MPIQGSIWGIRLFDPEPDGAGIHFAKAATQNMLTLPGSDPLPAKGETAIFGKLSAIVDISCCNPATELRDWVRKQTDLIYPPSGLGVSGMLRRNGESKVVENSNVDPCSRM